VQAPTRTSAPATIGKRIERGRFIGSPFHVGPVKKLHKLQTGDVTSPWNGLTKSA